MNHFLMELEITFVYKARGEDMLGLPALSVVYASNLSWRD